MPELNENSVGLTSAKTVRLVNEDTGFNCEGGGWLPVIDVEYEEYGRKRGDNTILLLHAFSADAHAAGLDINATPEFRPWRMDTPGWWDFMIGPNKPIDTNRFHVVCPNVLGSCYGTTGPSSINPQTEKPYGLDFPVITVGDWVRLHALLLDYLEITKPFAVIGASTGGQQVTDWMLRYPKRLERAIILLASPTLSAQGLAFNAVGRHAIMSDANFAGGNYYDAQSPERGLAIARMLAHITYLSEQSMHNKFGRRLQNGSKPNFDFGIEFEVESYLHHQGKKFVNRFDANSYLYVTRAMDYFDPAASYGDGNLEKAVELVQADVHLASVSSDWLFTPAACSELAAALEKQNKKVSYRELKSNFGHDAFLIETDELKEMISIMLT